MNQNSSSYFRKIYKDQRGQMIPVVAFFMITLLGFAGIVVDFGHAFFCYRELQASTNAAALAAAAGMPNQTVAQTYATSYSSVSGKNNAFSNLTLSGSPLVKFKCVTSMSGLAGCVLDTGGGTTLANAVQVVQQAKVQTTFLGLLGLKSMPIAATATAAMRGAPTIQYNVAIIIDATKSMSDTDSDSQCNNTRLSCALAGVQVLLQNLTPCATSGCGTLSSANYTHALDRVSLLSFPNVTTGTVAHDYCSGGSSTPTPAVYTYPTSTSSSWSSGYTPISSDTYQVTPFTSDYQNVSGSTTVLPTGALSTTSNLSVAAGANSSSCAGLSNPGGEGTYYAGVIYAAQAALTAQQAANAGSQNVMILLSDGDATSCYKNGSVNTCSGSTASQMSATGIQSNGTYPSYTKECQQAVTAAQAATTAGTTVYAVAYGAESSGCSTDASPYNSPCYTMQHIASNSTTFFSDYTATGSSSNCISASRPTSNLNQIFSYIAGDLSHARLIPNNAT
ncbi:MAG TPA: pilus assembly protein TadG-related protein [Alloacidobacterium sp.]|nr:pilus assembly protein TadG-related protein [Alloacidobacterium sp.]